MSATRKAACLAVAVLWFGLAASVLAESETRLATAEDRWAQPIRILPPSFPKDFRPEMLPLEIKLKGTVTTEGTFTSPVFDAPEGSQAFVDAIEAVLPSWRFRPAASKDTCKTVESEAVLSVFFELKDGKPSIFVSSPVVKAADLNPGVRRDEKNILVRQPKIKYPDALARAGIEGFSEVLFSVDSEGAIVDKAVLFSIPNVLFANAVFEGFRGVRFTKEFAPEKPGGTTCFVQYVSFCLAGVEPINYRNPRCAH